MIGMFNGFGQWVQSTNQSQAAISGTLQALTAQLATLSTQTATIQQSAISNPATATPAAPVSGPSGSVCIKEPCQFTGKATDVEAFLDESIFLSLYLTDGNLKSWYQAI
ncbi:hypothetical protein PAXRUDRAFT_17785 [Paxillus rubicundulus Ve08.2h10]|uniref:Uncharacterized protein n=1 Tax=Paxillus rubicundulus Ve08.2h10 TaxID=930991 RepID=A0A0D0D9B0_9AGAM|nr:hypothetical protein PAXRUDRAFT_17785 [Paxillus rubicundulus Ve08.2h10]